MPHLSHNIDHVAIRFDHDQAVANAGMIATATLAGRLGIEKLADDKVTVGFRPGRKLLTLVDALVAGGDCIDDVDVLRAGAASRILDHDVVAASTVGTWLRQLTFGHVRQLDHVTEQALGRAWASGAGPDDTVLTIDIDSTICEVHGYAKQGATFGYTKVRGLHPLVATRADTGEILHVRTRKGSANTGRGAARFVRETIGRVRRAGATGPIVLRADAGFWSRKVIAACVDHGVAFSITVTRQKVITDAIDAIDEGDWVDIDYTDSGRAQVAETTWAGHRLIVRRTELDADVPQLFAGWRHHAFTTNRDGDPVALDADHRAHAVVELAIRDLKHGAGLTHMPSGIFTANAAWTVAATLAPNLIRWAQLLATDGPVTIRTAATFRRRLLALPGRLVRSARRWTLKLPTRWPWADTFTVMLLRLRALPTIA